MTTLIASVGTGKGTWAVLYKLIEVEAWDSVIFVTNSFGKENFKCPDNGEVIVVDEVASSDENVRSLVASLQGKISYDTVAVNLVSGSGKQHMEVLGALLKLGANFRLVVFEDSKVVEI